MARPQKIYAKVLHMYAGLDLIGSKTTVSHREAEIEVTSIGCRIRSKKTKRTLIIPYSNIKGVELLPALELDPDIDGPEEEEQITQPEEKKIKKVG
jgi:hypothetical protein